MSGRQGALLEIAEKLGVAVSQVSRVLNNKGEIAPATRRRIIREARRHPELKLSGRHRPTLAIIAELSQINNNFLGMISVYIQEAQWNIINLHPDGLSLLEDFMVDELLAVDISEAAVCKLAEYAPRPPLVVRRFTAGKADCKLDFGVYREQISQFFQTCGVSHPLVLTPDAVINPGDLPDSWLTLVTTLEKMPDLLAGREFADCDALISFMPILPPILFNMLRGYPAKPLVFFYHGDGYPRGVFPPEMLCPLNIGNEVLYDKILSLLNIPPQTPNKRLKNNLKR